MAAAVNWALYDLRAAAGLTDIEAAAWVGVSRRTWLGWLRGRRRAPGYAVKLLRVAAGFPPSAAADWSGFHFWRGVLLVPDGSAYTPADIRSWFYLHQKLALCPCCSDRRPYQLPLRF